MGVDILNGSGKWITKDNIIITLGVSINAIPIINVPTIEPNTTTDNIPSNQYVCRSILPLSEKNNCK